MMYDEWECDIEYEAYLDDEIYSNISDDTPLGLALDGYYDDIPF